MRKIILSLLVLGAPLFLNVAFADINFTNRPDVQAFIKQMVKKHHFNKTKLVDLFAQVKIRPQVITSINKPLEKRPWHLYQLLFVSEWNIQNGVKFWNKHAETLKRAEKVYGVPANIIVATIGIETKYGQKTGEFRVIDSLSNLAFSNSPRANFFRSELEQYLLLSREEHFDPLKMLGSYAGAMGQPQFMPSSYRNYAVNFSNSGKIDLMHNEIDIIGSVANYYKKKGWESNGMVAEQAFMVGQRYHYFNKKCPLPQTMTIAELSQYGVVPKKKISQDNLKAKVIELESLYSKEYWLGFHNFDVIRRYNASNAYAMAVHQLSTYIADLRKRSTNG